MEDSQQLLDKARMFAFIKHNGQVDKGGNSYFIHPRTVAERVRDRYQDDKLIVAAYLHDVVEDCGVSLGEIEKEFGIPIYRLVDKLSRRPGESVNNYYDRLCESRDAIKIKIEDLIHNAEIDRLHGNRDIESFDKAIFFLKKAQTLSIRLKIGNWFDDNPNYLNI